mmetsp:Transcript_54949/g.154141  ORF Transcript_54949/g.154141 Transcript_54949/m.154141 type:complete len:203 (-) Transcript_54949:72-680(-)
MFRALCCQPAVDVRAEDTSENLSVEETLAALRAHPASVVEVSEPAHPTFASFVELRKSVDCEQASIAASIATRAPTCSPSMSEAGTECTDNLVLEWPAGGKCDRTGDTQKRERIQRLRCFLATSGFTGVNAPRKTGLTGLSRGLTYPLHAAVRANNADAVAALLWAGADRSKRDSHGRSPAELARSLTRGDSHTKVLEVLTA